MIIAIDGPSGSGKSSVSIKVAAALGFAYLDTGAIYRAIAASGGTDSELEISTDPRSAQVWVNGVDISERIRTPEVTALVSTWAAKPEVRAYATSLIRSLIKGNCVVEGRDIGTVVLPEADLKIFLTAEEATRADRRANEWQSDSQIAHESIASRDLLDSTRSVAPLTKALDAVLVDSTHSSIGEVVDQILSLVKERL